MAVGIQVKVSGNKAYQKALVGLSPKLNKKIQSLGLRKVAFEVSVFAKKKAIRPLSKKAPVHPRMITSRTNVGVDSIGVDLSKLPGESSTGSDKIYMAVHEGGGKFVRARPWLQVAVDAIVPSKSEEIVREVWEGQIRGVR